MQSSGESFRRTPWSIAGPDRGMRPGRRRDRAASSAPAAGYGDLISFDMGGTTAKASIIGTAHAELDEYEVGGGISASSH